MSLGGVRIVILDEVRLTWGSDTSSVVTGTAPGVERSQGEHRLLLLGAGGRPFGPGRCRVRAGRRPRRRGMDGACARHSRATAGDGTAVLVGSRVRHHPYAQSARWGPAPRERLVVPSMRGCMALWQWDAYFIAVGLRHGILNWPSASSRSPCARTRTGSCPMSSTMAVSSRRARTCRPATSPPSKRPDQRTPRESRAAHQTSTVGMGGGQSPHGPRRGQAISTEWRRGTRCSAPARHGGSDQRTCATDAPCTSIRIHRGSTTPLSSTRISRSGLPDLPAYLAVQERVLARWRTTLESAGHPVRVGRDGLSGGRSWREATVQRALERLWDPRRRMFAPAGASGRPLPRTILSLVACFAGGIGGEQIRRDRRRYSRH